MKAAAPRSVGHWPNLGFGPLPSSSCLFQVWAPVLYGIYRAYKASRDQESIVRPHDLDDRCLGSTAHKSHGIPSYRKLFVDDPCINSSYYTRRPPPRVSG